MARNFVWTTGLSLIALGAAGASLAWAQSATQPINVKATVAKSCSINTATLSSSTNMTQISLGVATSQFQMTTPVNALGNLQGANLILTYGAVCNTNSRVVLKTANGGMKPSPVPVVNPSSAAAFRTRINYTAGASWSGTSGVNATVDETATPGDEFASGYNNGPRASNLTVSIAILPDPLHVMAAGVYTDIVTVRLEPQ